MFQTISRPTSSVLHFYQNVYLFNMYCLFYFIFFQSSWSNTHLDRVSSLDDPGISSSIESRMVKEEGIISIDIPSESTIDGETPDKNVSVVFKSIILKKG